MFDANPVLGTSGGPDALAQRDPADPRPTFRVAVFGLAHKFQRLAEIVLRHARHNRYHFVIAAARGPGDYEVALVDMTAKGGAEVARTLLGLPGGRPVVRFGRRNDAVRGHDDLLQTAFTMDLLSTLNRVVEGAFLGPGSVVSMPRTMSSQLLVDDGGEPRPPRALIVDDSPSVRSQLAMALQRMGIESHGVGSAREAREALSEARYELALVDVMMPEVNGFKLTRELKRDRTLRAMPVVILTARSSPLDLARGALAGCNCYLVKPVSMASLRDTMVRMLKLSLAEGARRGDLRLG